jgi:protein tyrosine phosphatase (PTP) superfamily phosphohydrolase (DUF442 family)
VRVIRPFALASLGACVLAGCTHDTNPGPLELTPLHAPTFIQASPQKPIDIDPTDLPNFGFVTRDVWRGGQPSDAGMGMLARAGVKTVIDLREEGPAETVPAGVRLVRLPVSAWHADSVNPDALLHTIADNPKPVFIHCREGRDRTGLAVAIYRLSTGMSAADACRELRNFHVNVWWQGPIERRIYQLQASGVHRAGS